MWIPDRRRSPAAPRPWPGPSWFQKLRGRPLTVALEITGEPGSGVASLGDRSRCARGPPAHPGYTARHRDPCRVLFNRPAPRDFLSGVFWRWTAWGRRRALGGPSPSPFGLGNGRQRRLRLSLRSLCPQSRCFLHGSRPGIRGRFSLLSASPLYQKGFFLPILLRFLL